MIFDDADDDRLSSFAPDNYLATGTFGSFEPCGLISRPGGLYSYAYERLSYRHVQGQRRQHCIDNGREHASSWSDPIKLDLWDHPEWTVCRFPGSWAKNQIKSLKPPTFNVGASNCMTDAGGAYGLLRVGHAGGILMSKNGRCDFVRNNLGSISRLALKYLHANPTASEIAADARLLDHEFSRRMPDSITS